MISAQLPPTAKWYSRSTSVSILHTLRQNGLCMHALGELLEPQTRTGSQTGSSLVYGSAVCKLGHTLLGMGVAHERRMSVCQHPIAQLPQGAARDRCGRQINHIDAANTISKKR